MVKPIFKILFFTFSFLVFQNGTILYAQDSKELEQKADDAKGEEKLSYLVKAADKSLLEDKEKKCIQLAEDAVGYADKLIKKNKSNHNILSQKAAALHLIGKAHLKLGKSEDALESLSQALELYEELEDEQALEKVLVSIESVQTSPQKQTPKWWKGVKDQVNSLELGRRYQDKKRNAIIGYFEKNAKKHEEDGELLKATEYYLKSIRWYEEVGDSLKVLDTYQHVAELFLEMGNIEAAEATLKYVESLDPRLVGDSITDLPEVIPPFEEFALDIDSFPDTIAEIDSVNKDTFATEITQKIIKPDLSQKSSEYGQQLLMEIKKIQPNEHYRKELITKRDTYQKLASDLSKKGDYKTAVKYYQLYIAAQEKLLLLSRKRLFDSLKASYQIEEKADQIDKLQLDTKNQALLLQNQQAELEKQTQIRRFLVIIVLILLIASAVSYKLFNVKKKAHKDLEKAYEDLDDAHHQLKSAQTTIVQSEKMASLGQLTAGIAHELNNPINFVSANVKPLRKDIEELKELLSKYGTLLYSDNPKGELEKIEQHKEEIDLDFLTEEIEGLLVGMEEGASRTREIVNGLRNFSRLDEDSPKIVDIHEGLDSTLVLLKNKLKKSIHVEKEFDPTLPSIECFPGPINQVFMNILANAIHAIEDSVQEKSGKGGAIKISTKSKNDNVEIAISDSGCGMSAKVQERIFEPFYTTKDVGRGTGLGLSIAYGIIKNHHGTIEVTSHPEEGTTFVISLPKRQALSEESNTTENQASTPVMKD